MQNTQLIKHIKHIYIYIYRWKSNLKTVYFKYSRNCTTSACLPDHGGNLPSSTGSYISFSLFLGLWLCLIVLTNLASTKTQRDLVGD